MIFACCLGYDFGHGTEQFPQGPNYRETPRERERESVFSGTQDDQDTHRLGGSLVTKCERQWLRKT